MLLPCKPPGTPSGDEDSTKCSEPAPALALRGKPATAPAPAITKSTRERGERH